MSGMTHHTLEKLDSVLAETLSLSQEFINDIIQQITVMEAYVPEKEYFWNLQLSALSSDLTNFVELTTLLSKIVMNKKKLNLPQIKQSHVHLLFILKGINQAQQKHDALVLEDLIKYELKDNLTQWKIDLIPLIKRLLNS